MDPQQIEQQCENHRSVEPRLEVQDWHAEGLVLTAVKSFGLESFEERQWKVEWAELMLVVFVAMTVAETALKTSETSSSKGP